MECTHQAANKDFRSSGVVAFNTAERWARVITEDVARELIDTAFSTGEPLT
jgi:hypothetical protein